MGPGDFWAVVLGIGAGTTVLLSPVIIVRMILGHREKMAMMRLRPEGVPDLKEDVAALRREIAEMRETTTHFDMSFDAAICRLENRLELLENGKRGPDVAAAPEETVSARRRP